MPEIRGQFIREVAGAGPPTVPEKESAKERPDIAWSPEATARGHQLASQIKELDQRIKTFEDRGDLKSARALFPQMEALAAEMDGIRREEETRGEFLAREMRELFKDGFLGLEEVETAFTLKDGSKLIELNPAERQQALRLLEEKLKEPDIKEFLGKTPKTELAQNWLLVLRVPQLQDKTPLTMKALEEKLAPDMAARNQGKLLVDGSEYPSESFYAADTPGLRRAESRQAKDMHWQLVTRAVVPKTKGKEHSDQTKELKKAAQAVHLDPTKTRRRAPVETLFDSFVSFRATGNRLLETEWDWSDFRSSDGLFVFVGSCDAEGACVHGDGPEFSSVRLGASLSR